MSTSAVDTSNFRRPMMVALAAGLVAAVVSVVGLFVSGASLFFQAYLFAFLFCLGLSLGSLFLLLIHFTVASRWGLTIRRVVEAAAGSVWVLGILFIPILFGLSHLYPWVNPALFAEPLGEEAAHMMEGKAFYLNVPFFIVRAVLFFVIWTAVAMLANRMSKQMVEALPDDLAVRGRLQRNAALLLIVMVLTVSFAAVDWVQSLQPLWTSTAFGLIIIVGQVMSAMAFALVMLNVFPSLSLGRRWSLESTPVPYKDLGALLLVFVLGWAYLAYFQLLIIWAGNIPREVVWYLARIGGWSPVIIFVAVFQFVLPFLALLTIRVRHNLRVLALLGGLLLVTNLVNVFWHVKPTFSPGVFAISWLDIVLPVAMLGIWLAGFFFTLARRPALTEGEAVAMRINEAQEVRRTIP